VKSISLAAATVLVVAAPLAAKPAPTTKAHGQKTGWSQTLATAIQRNSEGQYTSLYEACDRADFPALAAALYAARNNIAPDKNEYWTDAEFADLQRHAEDAVNTGGRLVVCQPLDDNKDAPFAYDANREAFDGEFIANQTVWRDYRRSGSYVGQTAMGARTRVHTGLEREYNLRLTWEYPIAPEADCREHGLKPGCRIQRGELGEGGCVRNRAGTYNYEVSVPRDKAEALKANGYLVFLGRLKYPFIVGLGLDGSPTITDPRDIDKMELVVDFTPEEIAIVGPAGKQWTCKIDPAHAT
jgi:hypothetical protein